MAAATAAALMEPIYDVDKLSYEIFSILESKFLFGYGDSPTLSSPPLTPLKPTAAAGKVRILSIDGGGRASDALLACAALARIEASLRRTSGDPAAHIADFFDVAAGSGAGGVLAAMLFTRGPDGRPLFSAEAALHFLAKNGGKMNSKKGMLGGIFRRLRSGRGIFRRMFGEATLRDTVKPVLVPCYDLATGAPFLFSRADAVEMDGYDFKISDVCAATCADGAALEMGSVDGRTRICALGGAAAMANPTAAAITHVLHNKQEFPLTASIDDLLVLSLGTGEAAHVTNGTPMTPSTAELVRIAGDAAADMVDQAVATAFGHNKTTNYIRIQANRFNCEKDLKSSTDASRALKLGGDMLAQRNMQSILFRGKKISERTNLELLESFAEDLVKEQARRKACSIPLVMIKQVMTPRTSSATTATTTTVSSMAASV